MKAGCEVVSGIRPSGRLTLGNYVGAVKLFLDLQEQGLAPRIFVADLHLLTDREAEEGARFSRELVLDYLACGLEPDRCSIYLQSGIEDAVCTMTCYLLRHISVSELTRVPTLKDKLRSKEKAEQANALLAAYPVMMASDILLQRARCVSVGADQLAHLEVVRKIAHRFNERYGNVLPIPSAQLSALRILGLKGNAKMGKTNPQDAIFLDDSVDTVVRKVRSAKTAVAGEMNDTLSSHITLARALALREEELAEIDTTIEAHLNGAPVMGRFKEFFSELVVRFLTTVQAKRRSLAGDYKLVEQILDEGLEVASKTAYETLADVRSALGLRSRAI